MFAICFRIPLLTAHIISISVNALKVRVVERLTIGKPQKFFLSGRAIKKGGGNKEPAIKKNTLN